MTGETLEKQPEVRFHHAHYEGVVVMTRSGTRAKRGRKSMTTTVVATTTTTLTTAAAETARGGNPTGHLKPHACEGEARPMDVTTSGHLKLG